MSPSPKDKEMKEEKVDLLTLALLSGEMKAIYMLITGDKKQRKLALDYLKKQHELEEFYENKK